MRVRKVMLSLVKLVLRYAPKKMGIHSQLNDGFLICEF